MATTTTSTSPSQATDAAFRAWVAGIITGVTGVGFVQSSDTGQIDTTTVLAPTGASTVRGFAMFRFADTLQATAPGFLKLEFGSGATAATPQIWFSAGTATNGAGTFTGTQISTRTASGNLTANASALVSVFGGGTNRVACGLWVDGAAATTVWLNFERSKDAAGADDGVGLLLQFGTNVTHWQQYVPASGGVPTLETSILAVCSSAASSSFGGDVSVGPSIPLAGQAKNPGVGCLVYASTDFASGSSPSVTMYGTARTYYALGNPSRLVGNSAGLANQHVMIRYE